MSERDPAAVIAELSAALQHERTRNEAFLHLSHEIRTLLNGVLGVASLLLDTDLSPDQRGLVKQIRSSGDALVGLLNDVLDFTRVEAGKIEIEHGDLDVRRVADEVGELCAERAAARGLELVVALPPDLPWALRGDAARLRQVLLNLVSNAIKFTDRGEVVIRAAVVADDGEAVTLRFEVSDTGVGIPAEKQALLFQPFSQVHAGRGQGGSGLGLALAKRLSEAMGGSIGVESEPGRGSTFHVTVRLERRAPATERSAIPRAEVQGRRVLVAAASGAARAHLRAQCEAVGLACDAAPDAERAIRLLRERARAQRPFDVAILDHGPGGAFAPAFLRAIEAEEMLAPVRVAAIAYPGQRLDDPRVAAHLAKPVRAAELHAALRRLLGAAGKEGSMRPGSYVIHPTPPTSASAPALAGDMPRVLLVEDNAVNQRVARVMVERRGYRVDVASDGGEAIEAARRTPYAAVLMDCQMPRVDGYAATAEIRRLEGDARRTPIVAMTANVGPGERDRCLGAGMDDYLTKPILAEDLDRVLDRWAPHPIPGRARAHAAPSPVIDPEAIGRLRAIQRPGEKDLVADVIALFLADAPGRIASMREAIARGDLQHLGLVAHTLKGSAGHLGARALVALCRRLEEKVRAGAPFDVDFAVSAIEEELDRVRRALLAHAPPASPCDPDPR